jgi:hypothetical protein
VKRAVVIVSAFALGAFGCTFLVDFNDQPLDPCADGGCDDVTIDVAPDVADAAPDIVEADAPPNPCATLEAGAICDYAGGCTCNTCQNGTCSGSKKCPEGYNWDTKNSLARCCGGLAVVTNTNANCGVCGVVCKTAGVTTPQDCKLLSGHYLCVGCSANSECWSQCCSSAPTPSHCAASDCNTGNCPNGICPAPAKCEMGPNNTPNFCAY